MESFFCLYGLPPQCTPATVPIRKFHAFFASYAKQYPRNKKGRLMAFPRCIQNANRPTLSGSLCTPIRSDQSNTHATACAGVPPALTASFIRDTVQEIPAGFSVRIRRHCPNFLQSVKIPDNSRGAS